jgi:pyridoxal phosphate enzyme (YggS family)
MIPSAVVTDNLAPVRRRLEAAAHRAHRNLADIALVAVTKTVPAEIVRIAVEAGQRLLGENRVQEALTKLDALADLDVHWHLIGHLQSNKAKRAAAGFACIESIDSLPLIEKLDTAAREAGTRPTVLFQVDLAREATKHGARVDVVRSLVDAARQATALDLRGLMIVPPNPGLPEDSRPWFRQLRTLRDDLVAGGVPPACLRELSMGMSHDFEVAIEEGATTVRVGSAIFGARPPGASAP